MSMCMFHGMGWWMVHGTVSVIGLFQAWMLLLDVLVLVYRTDFVCPCRSRVVEFSVHVNMHAA